MTAVKLYWSALPDGLYELSVLQGVLDDSAAWAVNASPDGAPVVSVASGGVTPVLAQIAEPQPYSAMVTSTMLDPDNYEAVRPSGTVETIISVEFVPVVDGAAVGAGGASAEGEEVTGRLIFGFENTAVDEELLIFDDGGDPITVGAAANLPPVMSNRTPATIRITV